jgi:hypothetical protein
MPLDDFGDFDLEAMAGKVRVRNPWVVSKFSEPRSGASYREFAGTWTP